MRKIKGFSLLEVIFALSIACLLFSAMTSQFVSTKKLHLGTTGYLNKVYLAETIVKLLKDQVHINPYFYLNINNVYVKDKLSKGYIFEDEQFEDKLSSSDYEFKATDIPIITKGKNGDNSTYYFGFFKSSTTQNAVSGTSLANNIFLNVRDLEKYSYDLEIKNEKTTTLEGILKEVTITVKSTDKKDMPFIVTTKMICPPESLWNETYSNFQANLFKDSFREYKDKVEKLLPQNLDDTIKTDFIQKIHGEILKVLKLTNNPAAPSPLYMEYYGADGSVYEIMLESKKKSLDLIKQIYMIMYVLDYNNAIQAEYDRQLTGIDNIGSLDKYKKMINIYTNKAQMAIQAADQIQEPFQQICDAMGKGTEDTSAVIISYFINAAGAYPLDTAANVKIKNALSSTVPKLKSSFENDVITVVNNLNALFSKKFKPDDLLPAEIFKYTKQLLSFHQLYQIEYKVNHGNTDQNSTIATDTAASINTLINYHKTNNYNAALVNLKTELTKIANFNTVIEKKYNVISSKIDAFNKIQKQFDMMNATSETILVALNAGIVGSLASLNSPDVQWQLFLKKDEGLNLNNITIANNFGANEEFKNKFGKFDVSIGDVVGYCKAYRQDHKTDIQFSQIDPKAVRDWARRDDDD